MGKLLFFDVDETTFSNRTQCVPQSAKKAFTLAKEHGHKIFINTGRPFGFIGKEVSSIPVDGYLCGNGNCIVYHDQLLYHKEIPTDICQKMNALFPKHHIKGCLETKDCSYFYDKDDHFHPHQDNMQHLFKHDSSMPVEYSFQNALQYEKFVCFSKNRTDMDAFVAAIKELNYPFTYIKNSDTFYEIIPSDKNKGTSIQYMAEYLNTSLDDCYAFGDAPNDIPMFEVAGHSILLGNGYEELKSTVEYVTTDIDEDGIYNALKYYEFI